MTKINLVQIISDIYRKTVNKNTKYIHNQKYSIEDYVTEIIQFLNNETYWTRHIGKINGKLLNSKHNEFVKHNIYELAYQHILNLHLQRNKISKLKYCSTDVLFIKNKGIIFHGLNESNKKLGRCKYYKNKRGIKVSVIVDSFGIPINLNTLFGNFHDSMAFRNTFNPESFITESSKPKYFLADSAYDSNDIRTTLINHNFIPLIDVNKRNSKSNTTTTNDRLYKSSLNKMKYKKVYKKRSKVEHYFSWLTRYPKMNMVVESTIESFKGLVYLAASLVLTKKINK